MEGESEKWGVLVRLGVCAEKNGATGDESGSSGCEQY